MLTPEQMHGAARSWRGRFRIYYNGPQQYAWAIDDGGQAGEINVMTWFSEVNLSGSHFEGKRQWPEPTVYAEGYGLVEIKDGVAYITP